VRGGRQRHVARTGDLQIVEISQDVPATASQSKMPHKDARPLSRHDRIRLERAELERDAAFERLR
jgi:hypothetical protein